MRIAILDDYQGVGTTLVDWHEAGDVTVVPYRDHVEDEPSIAARLAPFDCVMRIRERTTFSRTVIDALPKLKLILATGMRNARSIDLAATDAKGITVCATDVHHTTTVEIVWMMLLALFRGYHRETKSLSAGAWQWGLGRSLEGKTLGIVGLGKLGQPVARIAQSFGMRVIAWSPNLTPERTARFGVCNVSKEELFRTADAVTIHMPDTNATRGIVGQTELGLMKSSAFLINTARPGLVDQDALLLALRNNRIAGAGLDVFDIEPLPRDSVWRALPNVIATPHIGFVTLENYEIFFQQSLENLKAYLAGEPIRVITSDRPFLDSSPMAGEVYVE
ncbi:MAG: D-2-hydroxyacid dehydrogenase family protein [Hyphomicrobiaceae bacterium]